MCVAFAPKFLNMTIEHPDTDNSTCRTLICQIVHAIKGNCPKVAVKKGLLHIR